MQRELESGFLRLARTRACVDRLGALLAFAQIGHSLGMILPGSTSPWLAFGAFDVVLFAVMYFLSILVFEVGHHRLFAHGAFKAPFWLQYFFCNAGMMAGLLSLPHFVAVHRKHHKFADGAEDPHSPARRGPGLRGLVRGVDYAYKRWFLDANWNELSTYAPDWFAGRDADKNVLRAQHRHYNFWWALGLLVPAVIGGVVHRSPYGALNGFVWGGCLRLVALRWVLGGVVQAFNHLIGSRPFQCHGLDSARNHPLLSLPTVGIALHNNHHAFPSSATTAFQWWQLDPSYWVIRLLEVAGLAWDVKRPTRTHLLSRRTRQSGAGARSLSDSLPPAS